jgi:hypothetical protein
MYYKTQPHSLARCLKKVGGLPLGWYKWFTKRETTGRKILTIHDIGPMRSLSVPLTDFGYMLQYSALETKNC